MANEEVDVGAVLEAEDNTRRSVSFGQIDEEICRDEMEPQALIQHNGTESDGSVLAGSSQCSNGKMTESEPKDTSFSQDRMDPLSDGENNAYPERALRGGPNQTSLELRRLPVDVLLNPDCGARSSIAGSMIDDDFEDQGERSCIRMCCLNPNFRLRTQLMCSFGSVSAIMIAIVLCTLVVITWDAANGIKDIHTSSFENLVNGIEGKFVRYLSDSLTPRLIPDDTVRILHESVRDRFAGYPNDGDDFVPFFDVDSQSNKYPIVGVEGSSLPLDWDIESNVNDENFLEHVQNRWEAYASEPALSTANAFYIQQGQCDPSVTDPSALTYWPNCTDANNDVTTGGAIFPTSTSYEIYRKSRSLAPLLKAVYESQQDLREFGAYFANSGAGATVSFPHYLLRGNNTYVSQGCEWMSAPNPFDPSRPIATKEEIARCRPEGAVVSTRLYNPMEREWCKDQALNPFEPVMFGPFFSAWDQTLLSMGIGQAVYDRLTNNFIACIYVGWLIDDVEAILKQSKVTPNQQVSVARWDDRGTVLASTAWAESERNEMISIHDLDVGLTEETYLKLRSLIDYEKEWEPDVVRKAYETFTVRHNGFFVGCYPMPPIPEEYDPNYRPQFFVSSASRDEDVFKVVKDVNEEMSDNVRHAMFVCALVGAIGLAIVILIIFVMSNILTAPLRYMNSEADEIMNSFGSSGESGKKIDSTYDGGSFWCTPKTELNEVLKEFNKMISSFGGTFDSSAKTVKWNREEVANGFQMQRYFRELYESRNEKSFAYKMLDNEPESLPLAGFVHWGSNIIFNDTVSTRRSSVVGRQSEGGVHTTSRLFIWTALLIGTPLLLTILAISVAVIVSVSKGFVSSTGAAKAFYVKTNLDALMIYARLRADHVAGSTAKPVRDLQLLTRFASWLLFDSVERAQSFTLVKTGTEACKTFTEDFSKCPYFQENYVCDCAWNHNTLEICKDYGYDTRYFQDLYFSSEFFDNFPNGDRNSTSFPSVCYSPESCAWWENSTILPGSENALSSGYKTAYDRLRVISASPVHQLVFNQDVEKKYTIANYISFEADGMFFGFQGCRGYTSASRASWYSSEENGAYKLRPEICPLGKYGYDPRCRGWYDAGKKAALDKGSNLHITAPYIYAESPARKDLQVVGQSATSPLIDPRTNVYVGQVLVDFSAGWILDALDERRTPLSEGSFPTLITTQPGADSVVGPGFSALNSTALPISELVLPFDHACSSKACKARLSEFQEIVASMKRGESGRTSFKRTSSEGSEERVHIVYVPVVIQSNRPLDSSDFSRGVERQDYTVYSLALAESEKGLLNPFKQIEHDTSTRMVTAVCVLCVVILLSAFIVAFVSNVVTLSMTEPMLYLVETIRAINRLKIDEEPLLIDRSTGSREAIAVSETVQTLFKIIRCGNCAFFSGDLEKAYAVLRDALKLFQRLDNKKAVGIVSNNLGNLLLVAYRTMIEAGEEEFYGMTKADLINKGTVYFHDAIQLGEKAYDEFHEREGWSPNCLDFMQHLSNRYFNRAMFLLCVKDGHEHPEKLENLGFRDLQIARDMDLEISDAGEEAGWGNVDRPLKLLDVALVRTRGHLLLQELGYPDEWEIKDLLDETFKRLRKEMTNDCSSLFQTITDVGRLQEVEAELITYHLLKGEVKVAAQIGIRMLFEDECTFPVAQLKSIEALSAYAKTLGVAETARSNIIRELEKYRDSTLSSWNDGERTRMSATVDESEELNNLRAVKLSVGNSQCVPLKLALSIALKESRRGYVTMEDF